MRHFAIGTVLALTISAAAVRGQCESPLPVREIQDHINIQLERVRLSTDEFFARRIAMLDEALVKFPDDFFLLGARLASVREKDDEIRWADTLLKRDPNRPAYILLHARSLEGRDTPGAIGILEALKTAHPDNAPAYLELAGIFESGKFKDKTRVRQELDGYLTICPATLGPGSLGTITQNATQEQLLQVATAVRKRMEAEDAPYLRATWTALWTMEFKAHPPTEHDAVRKQIAQDLERLEQSPMRHNLEWITFLRGGYQSAGDTATVNRLNEEIISRFGSSSEAERIVQERWRKDHPFPARTDKEKSEAYARQELAVMDEWIKRWPDDSELFYEKFTALADLPETTSEQVARAADEFFSVYRKNPYWSSTPPLQFSIAEAYNKHKIRLDQVPGLVEEGKTSFANSERNLADDRTDDNNHKMFQNSIDSMKLTGAGILLDNYAATKQPEKARELDSSLASVNAGTPYLKSSLLAIHAKAAEIEGRKLDALALYRAAINARPATPQARADDELAANALRLWKELGGSAEEFATLMDKPKVTEATDSRWEKPANPLPMFTVQDLSGKTWKLASFQGKAVLVNIWATWCGPCKMEHPEFQKLYDKLKDRADVAVFTINVDDDLGKVAPYMAENHFTFPVLLGHDVVDQVVPSLGIPRNWFITPSGKLEWEQIGFGPDSKWQDTMTAKLEEVLKQSH